MKNEELIIRELFKSWSGFEPDRVEFLPVSGSYRSYFRLGHLENSFIGVVNEDTKENDAFIDFTGTFQKEGLPVPAVIASAPSGQAYLLDDLGDMTLFSYLSSIRKDDQDFPEAIRDIYKQVITYLPRFQVVAAKSLDYSKCYPRQAFDRQSMMWDLNYFKYYFLKLARVPFDEQQLEDDFTTLVDFLLKADPDYFMYRDFQSRNIMIKNREPWFIDYQGGRKGPLQYDIASLLYDAKAAIPEPDRVLLLEYYLDELEKYLPVNRKLFHEYYTGIVLIRILQAFGAYGFRGYYENKPHFLKSIPYAISNLEHLLEKKSLPVELPMLREVLDKIIANPLFRTITTAGKGLTLKITSFSYKNGIPADESGNGGGFVFDCRALPNPGRYEEYRLKTGNDTAVIEFLEKEAEVAVFLNHVFSIVDQSVKRYIERDFTSLSISFGCTGGQHRSVYCASGLVRHLRSKFDITIDLQHRELKDKDS